MSNDRILFDDGVSKEAVVAHDKPLPVAGGGTTGAPSGGVMTVQDPLLQDNGYEQITGLSTVKTLTVPANTVSALVQVDVSDVRYLMNGSNPTANVGNSMGVGDRIKFNAVEAASLKFIEVDSGAILDVQYEKAV